MIHEGSGPTVLDNVTRDCIQHMSKSGVQPNTEPSVLAW